MTRKTKIGVLVAFVAAFAVSWRGSDALTGGITDAFFGGGPGERGLYMKLPLDLPRFHWQFDSEEAVLAGRLDVRIAGHEGRDTTLTVFADGEMGEGWSAIESDRGDGELYFGFTHDGSVYTHPRDSVIVRFEAAEDLTGQGRWYTAVLPAGTYEAVASYSVITGHPTVAALIPGSRSDDEATAYIGCWHDRWPLRVTERRGWAGTPEEAAERYGGVLSFILRLGSDERGTDGRRCVEGGPDRD